MKYLITGITGFAAPHLANLLIDEGHEVAGLIRCSNGREEQVRELMDDAHFSKVQFLFCDLTDVDGMMRLFQEQKFDGVFHLAAQSHPPTSFTHPLETFEDNIMGSANLIQAIAVYQPQCRLMFCSTSEVYGNLASEVGMLKEDMKLAPSNPYGTSKAAIDLFMQERTTNKKIDGFVTRAFSHTGPGRGRRFSISSDAYYLARMMVGLEKGRTLPIGNLETQRVVMDVRDCVNAYWLLMQKAPSGEVYNVGGIPEQLCKMEVFTDTLIKLSGLTDVKKEIDPKLYRPIDIQVQIPDTTKLRTHTGWKPEIPLEKTLQDLLDYWVKKLTAGAKAA